MATPKLEKTREQRAIEIPAENILGTLPDARVMFLPSTPNNKRFFYGQDVYITSTESCYCLDHVARKNTCIHILRVRMMRGN